MVGETGHSGGLGARETRGDEEAPADASEATLEGEVQGPPTIGEFRDSRRSDALAEVERVLSPRALNDRISDDTKHMARELFVAGWEDRDIARQLEVAPFDIVTWRHLRQPGGIEDWRALRDQRATAMQIVELAAGEGAIKQQEMLQRSSGELLNRAYDSIVGERLFVEEDMKAGDEIVWARMEGGKEGDKPGKRVRVSGLKFESIGAAMNAIKLSQQIQESGQKIAMEERKFLTERGKVLSGVMAGVLKVIAGCERCEQALRDYWEGSMDGGEE